MKRSDILTGILIFVFLALLVAVFVIPQETQHNYELPFFGVIMPIMGLIWIRARADAMRGK
jgi:peptidoglycan/LPS O-acetylase OafA/YrhL